MTTSPSQELEKGKKREKMMQGVLISKVKKLLIKKISLSDW